MILDRDGVINKRPGRGMYVTRPAELELRPTAVAGLGLMAARGITLVIASNQSGIARGVMTELSVRRVNDHLVRMLRGQGIPIADIAVCPHDDGDECSCRKPAPGMLLSLAERHGVDLEHAIFVGDEIRDVRAALAAGTNAALIGSDDVSGLRPLFSMRGLRLIQAEDAAGEGCLWREAGDIATGGC